MIISFVRLPARRAMRWVSRAGQVLVQSLRAGNEAWDLSTAVEQLRKDVHLLVPNQRCHQCYRCAQRMPTPGCIVADAGQAYEQLDVDYVRESIDALFSSAQAQRFPSTITVDRTTRLSGRLGGRVHPPNPRCVVVRLQELRQALFAAVAAR
eukprot:15475050-Alexandrium_andersonii.AAC.1